MNELPPELIKILNMSQEDMLAADAEITTFLQENPQTSPALTIQAMIKSRQGQYDQAIEILKNLNELFPGSSQSYFNLGYCYRQNNQYNAAAEALQHAAELSQYKDIPVLTLLGSTYHHIGDLTSAENTFNKILSINPQNVFGLFYLLQLKKEQLDITNLLKIQKQLTELFKQDVTKTVALTHFISRYDDHLWRKVNDKGSLSRLFKSSKDSSIKTDFYPESYVLPDEHEQLSESHHKKPSPWIIKPCSLMGGQGIKLTNKLEEIPNEKGLLAQKYIDNPLLIDERKCNLRLYLLFESFDPLRAFLWKNAIVFIASNRFVKDLSVTTAHIANPLHGKEHPDRVVPKNLSEQDQSNFRDLNALFKHLDKENMSSKAAWNNICELAKNFTLLLKEHDFFTQLTKNNLRFASPPKFLGLDVLLTDQLKPYLLEVEQYPGLSGLNAVTDHVNKLFANNLTHFLSAPAKIDNKAFDIATSTRSDWLKIEEQSLLENANDFERIL